MIPINKILIIGMLQDDPKLGKTKNGVPVVEFQIRYVEQKHAKRYVSFFDVTAFGAVNESTIRDCPKGIMLLIDGKLAVQEWQDKQTGKKKSRIYLEAKDIKKVSEDEVEDELDQLDAQHKYPPSDDLPDDGITPF